MLRKHSITISSNTTALNEEAKGMNEGPDHRASVSGGRESQTEQPRLQLFYQEHADESRHVSGFGWMNDSKFFYGQYDAEDLKPKNPQGFNLLVLKRNNLKEIDYVKKERGLQPSEDEVPASFAITMFHVVFMYPTNITVVSKISRQVVFNHSFEKSRPLRGVILDTQKH